MRFATLLIATLVLTATAASAKIVTKDVDYKHGDVALRGFLAYDDSRQSAPGVLIVHEWWGLNDYVKGRARQVAELGYVAFALDMYGAGVTTDDPAKAGELAGAARAGVAKARERAMLGLQTLRDQPMVDKSRVAAMGYCFGGTVALELARAGADLKSVISFHGGLETTQPAAGKITPSILVLHGMDDPMVPPEQVMGFVEEMRAADADYQIVAYGNAVHAFTNPNADKYNLPPVKYNQKADRRSWEAMKAFLAETIGTK
jgi:dienelactone hydrolase